VNNGTDHITAVWDMLRKAYDQLGPGAKMPDELQTDRIQSAIREARDDLHAAMSRMSEIGIALRKEGAKDE
jgi:hypothetical protein